MIEIRRHSELGTMQLGWLDAHYHFSFANYHDAKRMGIGPLRVINDDIVKVGGGFDFHPHHDMEIITYVRSGAITHEDSLGNHGATRAGEVQVMSAGTGIVHAEVNHEPVDTTLYQIWIQPRTRGVEPRWEQRVFPTNTGNGLTLLVSGLAEHKDTDALMIHQDAAVWGGRLHTGQLLTHPLAGSAYLLVSEGAVRIGEVVVGKGDAVISRGETTLSIEAVNDAELVLIDLPTVH
ncbi:MAG: hypothetical protein C0436_00695 [Alphaproteobacteria bacterium]|nr:hypothetical protein [Alphaproteobacteria bacterium]